MNRPLFFLFVGALVLGGMLYSCSGDSNSGFIPATGTVALYVADDPVQGVYSQVTGTITGVQLVNTGLGASCNLLAKPVVANIVDLADVLQLVNVTQCLPGSYNRFRIEFDQNVQLVSQETGTASACLFESFKTEGSGSQPDKLNCDPQTGICRLDVNGAVNVLARKGNKVGLDFDLKNFDVRNAGMQNCTMTMKVSPLTPNGTRSEAVTGLISRLGVATKTFDLTRGNRTFSVLYSGITGSDQPGLDFLLTRAQTDGLRTRVTTAGIDLGNNSIIASRIEVKVEGTVSEFASETTFTVSYAGNTKTIGIDAANADVSGILALGSWVDAKLIGRQADSLFIADNVEVELPGTMTED